MAVEKVEKKTYEFTKAALFQLIGAGVCAILAVVLGWFAYTNWSFKSALVTGYETFQGDSVPATAKGELLRASSWKPEHAGVRQVLAKILCDAGAADLGNAEEQIRKAQSLGGDSADLKVAMGVVFLKRADLAKSEKEIKDLVGKAQTEFSGAGSAIEGKIGLGHCELLLANKLNDQKRIAAAAKIFNGVRNDLSGKPKISAGGLIDYYSGLGAALAASDRDEDLRDARESFRACAQLARGWESPRANMMAVDARRWSLWKGSLGEINAYITDEDQRRKVMGSYWKENRDPAVRERLGRSWALWSIAFAQALARAGNEKDSARILGEIKSVSLLESVAEPYLADAALHVDSALKPGLKPSEQDGAVSQALGPLDAVLKKHLTNPANDLDKDRKARVLNALAVMRFMQGSTQYRAAEDHLTEALKLFPEEYVYNRNLVIVLKRAKAPTAKLQPFLDKAKALATGPMAEDFDKVQKVLEEK